MDAGSSELPPSFPGRRSRPARGGDVALFASVAFPMIIGFGRIGENEREEPMALPDRTLCWVEGPPWDRECQPVGELFTGDVLGVDVDSLRRRLEGLNNQEMGKVLATLLSVLDERVVDLRSFLPQLAGAVEADPEISRMLEERS